MSATLEANNLENELKSDDRQFATFYVGDLLLAIDIEVVQEINRQIDVTPVPNAQKHVKGVINLRGEVVTVLDLRSTLGLPKTEFTPLTRNVIVKSQGEAIGLWVDRVADILAIQPDKISPAPANVNGIEGRFFKGVHSLEDEIAVLLDLDVILGDNEE